MQHKYILFARDAIHNVDFEQYSGTYNCWVARGSIHVAQEHETGQGKGQEHVTYIVYRIQGHETGTLKGAGV